ncbi:hypothetical protein [Natronobeatus ordinarius]|uniref:hypothetical protein n=1 Tax=Natronobeatus ordinarius TaxID=2963433 RepID=UPI0020CDC058|nr:hypothetical protein [Natronobeatus ordinarius]
MPTPLPPAFRETWRPVGTRRRRSRFALVSSVAETTLYEHGPTADALSGSVTAGERSVRSLFAIELRLTPPLPAMGIAPKAVLGMAASQVRRKVVDSVEAEGVIAGDERESSPFERADGTVGRRSVLESAVRLEPAGEDETRTIDAETHVAVWPTAESYGVAGGTLPLEDPPRFGAALEVDPERDREAVLEFVATVVPGGEDED